MLDGASVSTIAGPFFSFLCGLIASEKKNCKKSEKSSQIVAFQKNDQAPAATIFALASVEASPVSEYEYQ